MREEEGVSVGGEVHEGERKATVINCFKRFYLNKNYLVEMCVE